jgi:hypothetical protein
VVVHSHKCWCVSISLYTTTMVHFFSSIAHSLIYTEYIMCKLFIIQTVNENYFILSLLLHLSPILSSNVCIIVYLDIFCAGSTHLHGIRTSGLPRKIYTKKFCRYKRLKTAERWISKKNSFLHLRTIFHGRIKYTYIFEPEGCTS